MNGWCVWNGIHLGFGCETSTVWKKSVQEKSWVRACSFTLSHGGFLWERGPDSPPDVPGPCSCSLVLLEGAPVWLGGTEKP